MPPPAKSLKDKRSRQRARSKTKRDAKARERSAKAASLNLDYDETVRARMLAKAGIPPAEQERFLAAFAKHYKGRFGNTDKSTKPEQSPASPSTPTDAARSKK